MIRNENNIDMSLRNTWTPLANLLDKLGYDISVSSDRTGIKVYKKESQDLVGEVSHDMIKEEELDYILYSRLNLERK